MLRKSTAILIIAIALTTIFIVQAMAGLSRVEIIPPDKDIIVKSTFIFKARAYDEGNNDITDKTKLTWTCDDSDVGKFGSNGKFTASAYVSYTRIYVKAKYANDERTGSIDIETVPGPPAKLYISYDPDYNGLYRESSDDKIYVPSGESIEFTAWTTDAYGNWIGDVDNSAVVWKLSNSKIGTINEHGEFIAESVVGRYTSGITAQCGKLKDAGTIVVTPKTPAYVKVFAAGKEVSSVVELKVGSKMAFTAKAYDENDNEIKGLKFYYSANMNDHDYWYPGYGDWLALMFGRINSSGVFTAGKVARNVGYIYVTPAYNSYIYSSVGGSAKVRIAAGSPKTIKVDPISLMGGRETNCTVQLLDVYGNEIENPQIKWSVSKPSAGTINETGQFITGNTAGVYKKCIKAVATAGNTSLTGYGDVTVLEDITEADKAEAITAMSNIINFDNNMLWDPISSPNDLSGFSSSIEDWANRVNYIEAPQLPAGFAASSAEDSMQELTVQDNRASSTPNVDEWAGDWHWVGRISCYYNGYPVDYSLKGTNANLGSVNVIANSSVADTLTITASIMREDGKLFEGNLTRSITDGGTWPDKANVKATFKLDGKTVYTTQLKEEEYVSGYDTLLVNGTKTEYAENGYSVAVTIKDMSMDSLYKFLPYNTADVSFTTSNNYTGKLTIDCSYWTGQVFNANRSLIATVTNSPDDKTWTLNFIDGTISEPISYLNTEVY